jgi:drug/metabolite transporter (DMT)-like permease
MIPLILSIASSSIIFVIFKLFDKFKVDTFQAIVFNYFTACIIGFSLYGREWNSNAFEDTGWMLFTLISAVLFIGLFFIMGRSSQLNGVASTSVAVKMSMAVSIILMVIGYAESFPLLKGLGVGFAFLGVFLVSYSKTKKGAASSWMLIVLFLGSGALDFTLNYAQKEVLTDMTKSIFAAIGLGTAGLFGGSILLFQILRKKAKIEIKNIVAGIILGIPNYFSIYLLLLSYETTGWKDSTVLAITNVSVVLTSAIIGFIAFKENATVQKIIGLICAILAIAILYISN